MLFRLVLGGLAICYVESLCSLPCILQTNQNYVGPRERYQLSCKDSSRYFAISGNHKEQRECYDSTGPFTVVRRPGNYYQCMKFVKSQNKDVVFFFETPYTYFKNNPTLCEVCAVGNFEAEPVIVEGTNPNIINFIKAPPLGCNRPKNCPRVKDKKFIPCTGCELDVYGLSTCCKGCFNNY